MKHFDVTVQRLEYREHTFTVESDDSDDAHSDALDAANDHNFLDDTVKLADQEVTKIVPRPDLDKPAVKQPKTPFDHLLETVNAVNAVSDTLDNNRMSRPDAEEAVRTALNQYIAATPTPKP